MHSLKCANPGPTYDELIEAENTYFFIDGMDPIAIKRKYWDIWNRYTPNPLIYNKYADPPIPMLLLNGDLDPNTPIQSAMKAAQAYGANIDGDFHTFNNRYFITLPNAPHVVLGKSKINNFTDNQPLDGIIENNAETCGMYIIKSFINQNNGYIPDNGCLKWLSDIDFEGTSNVSKNAGAFILGTEDIWGVQSVDPIQPTAPTTTPPTINDTKGEEGVEVDDGSMSDEAKTWMIVGIVFTW